MNPALGTGRVSIADREHVGDLEVTILALDMRSWVTGVVMPISRSTGHREVSIYKQFLMFKFLNTVFSW